jgi:hypothetical protein
VGLHQETPLNVDLGINNERQDYKKGTVCVGVLFVEVGRANQGDESEGIWLMGFKCIYKIEQ